MELLLENREAVDGFEFNVSGIVPESVFGGRVEEVGFISGFNSSGKILGYRLTGDPLSEGDGLLTIVSFSRLTEATESCLSDPIFAQIGGAAAIEPVELGPCHTFE
jgi:hypothetical protein